MSESIPELVGRVTAETRIPLVKQMQFLTRLRLAKNFLSFEQRLKCVLTRLQAISILGEHYTQYNYIHGVHTYMYNYTFTLYMIGPTGTSIIY